MSEQAIIRENDKRLDELEIAILTKTDVMEFPLHHEFSDGIYIRTVLMPKGSLVVSDIHLTNHPFMILKGKIAISIDGKGWVEREAIFRGFTEPGTRRIVYVVEDCIWSTYHAIKEVRQTDNKLSLESKEALVSTFMDQIVEPHLNYITGTKTIDEYHKILDHHQKIIS